jgi:hypothetical protein
VWNSTQDSDVKVRIDGGKSIALTRTQAGKGEKVEFGVDYTDPFSAVRQLQVARYGFQSTSDNPRAQGFETGRGAKSGPGVPQSGSTGYIAEKSSHLWRVKMPTDLEIGTHVAKIEFKDRYGQTFTDEMIFEVREKRPPQFWITEPWENEASSQAKARNGEDGLLR